MDTFGEFSSSRPSVMHRVAVKLFVFMAGVLLMLARTSPALAADSHGDKGKASSDHSSEASAPRLIAASNEFSAWSW